MASFRKKIKSLIGFTLVELLAVIGIIAIMAGIAIPSVFSVQKNLKITELEAAAKTIFIAAQNRMSELRVSGEIDSLGGTIIDNEPSDFPQGFDWDEESYYYLSSADSNDRAAMQQLVPTGSIDESLASSYYIIEYSPATGMVYAVFYMEDEISGHYSQLDSLRGDAKHDERRNHSPMFGYYGGGVIDYTAINVTAPAEFRIINENELVLRIVPDTTLPIDYSVLLQDESGNSFELEFAHASILTSDYVVREWSDEDGSYVYDILLDSMDENHQFKDLFPTLTAGDNLKISITTSVADELPMTVYAQTNSLFAFRSGDSATLGCARHLQNLDTEFSGIENSPSSAALSGAIAWDNTLDFVSITNPALTAFSGNGNTISGLTAALFDTFSGADTSSRASISNLQITDFSVSGAGGNVGVLVGTASFTDFDKCYVYADSASTDENSAVLSSVGADSTGGLIGYAENCTVKNSFAAMTRISADSGIVGGLVGSAVNTKLETSYATIGFWLVSEEEDEDGVWHEESGIIAGADVIAGGFIGSISGGEIKQCYVTGNIAATTAAAGFTGTSTTTAAYYNSYAAVTYTDCGDDAKIYGFSSSAVTSPTCFYMATDTKLETLKTSAQEQTDEELAACMNGVSGWAEGSESTTIAYGRAGEIYPFPRLSTLIHHGDWSGGGEYSLGYGLWYYEKYTDGTYGFYSTSIDGTPMGSLSNAKEIAEDGYAILSDDAEAGDEMLVRYYGSNNSYLSYNKHTETLYALDCKLFEPIKNGEGEEDTTAVVAYLIGPDSLSNPIFLSWRDGQTAFYATVETPDGARLYFLPHFAKGAIYEANAAIEMNASGYPRGFVATEMTYEIRTARHLSRLAYITSSACSFHYSFGGSTYIQTRDIDFSTEYAGQFEMGPMFTARFLSGAYDGRGYTITGLDLDGTGLPCTGLIANAAGAGIRNIVFISDTGPDSPRTIKGDNDVGALVGNYLSGTYRSNTIENCRVEGFEIIGGKNVGGLIGRIGGTSTVSNCVTSGCSVTGANNVGGFVGSIDNTSQYNAGTIKNCAAANASFGASTSGGSITLTTPGGNAGGFAGFANKCKITDCYVVVTASAESESISGFIADVNIDGLIVSRRTTITDCYGIIRDSDGEYEEFTAENAVINRCMAYDGDNLEEILEAFEPKTAWGAASAANTLPYDKSLTGAYPFPAVVKDANGRYIHYGNWPVKSGDINITFDGGMGYYELYSDNSCGYYIEDETGISNTLRNDLAVLEDGYILITKQDFDPSSPPSVTITSTVSGWSTSNTQETVTGEPFVVDGYVAYYLRPNGNILESASGTMMDHIYATLSATVGGKTFTLYYNPHFAKAIGSSASDAITHVEIRTARHVLQLSKVTNNYNLSATQLWCDTTFIQTRDVDFATYLTTDGAIVSIASINGSSPFTGVYDGGGYVISGITEVSFNGSTGIGGFFGSVASGGQIKNVTLIADFSSSTQATITGGWTCTGALVGQNAGIIDNCSVSGFAVSGPVCVGGLVGRNTGVITNSYAANATFASGGRGGSVTATQSNGHAAGFVNINDGEVSNCYTLASLSAARDSNIYQSGTSYGFYAAGSGTIANSYCVSRNSKGDYLTFGSATPSSCYAYGVGGSTLQTILDAFSENSTWGSVTAQNTHPYDGSLSGAYPLPAVVKDESGNYIHYGNWPADLS